MKIKHYLSRFWPFYVLVFALSLAAALATDHAATAMSEGTVATDRYCIIIDAGHGGIDGGATSCSGVLESQLNLQIALRLNDLMQFLGYNTRMIRTEDVSIYTQGETIAAKKVSDLKERLRIANSEPKALYISIHQNYFPDAVYSGTQIFYPKTQGSQQLAQLLQEKFIAVLQPKNNRKTKKANGIYLMEHINCPAVLIECGFISNPEEEAKLRQEDYQKKLCCVIAATVSKYLDP